MGKSRHWCLLLVRKRPNNLWQQLWCTVSTGKLCPIGWHLPSDDDWTHLSDILDSNPGAKLRAKNDGVCNVNR